MPSSPTLVMDQQTIQQKIQRIAHQIYENHFEEKEIIFIGIAERGVLLAERLEKALNEISPLKTQFFKLSIQREGPVYHPQFIGQTPTNEDLNDKVVLLVDDVLNTGKTLIYGVHHLLPYALKSLITVVLVNRRHRLFPIRADYVGLTLATTLQEHISVELGNGSDAVYLK